MSNQITDQGAISPVRKVIAFLRMFFGQMTVKPDNGPIDSIGELERFIATRSAFVAQKKLYGYLKTRMGTKYPSMFEDDVFVQSINFANHHVFSACVSDLAIFAVAQAFADRNLEDGQLRTVAVSSFREAMQSNAASRPDGFSAEDALAAFEQRLAETDWPRTALTAENFTHSPKALIKWAPIAPELKKFDTEIVENSIKFAWLDIRARFLKRLDRDKLFADWTANRTPVKD